MFTSSAARAMRADTVLGVASRDELSAAGLDWDSVQRHLRARRWQRVGRAIIQHNGPLTTQQRWQAALINCGPRSVLTSFTALEYLGLSGWTRDEIHVLAPAGVPHPAWADLPVVLHRTTRDMDIFATSRSHKAAPAAVLAAASFRSSRPAVGVIAAVVQQRLTSTALIEQALAAAPRARHRAVLLDAVRDIAMGSDALSEIDFVRLCRRAGLPTPVQQAVRRDSSGRRRYLDAEWRRADGRKVAVEVDGALHLSSERWFADQLRQNEIALTGTTVLRFPSFVVRTEPDLVIAQLRRALGMPQS